LVRIVPLWPRAHAHHRRADSDDGVSLSWVPEADERAVFAVAHAAGGGLEVEGETEIGGEHRESSVHHFCAYCKNWLYTSGISGGQFVNFRPTMLDDASWVTPYIESYVSEKLPGVVSGAKHSFEKFPEPHQYPELMAGFAKDGAKP
jgi:hypothetical protein